jgi:hypothetical protein
MADNYGRWVPDEWIHQIHAAMLAGPGTIGCLSQASRTAVQVEVSRPQEEAAATVPGWG